MASTLATISSDKLTERFALLRSQQRKALVCYITAGYPDYGSSLDLMRGLQDSGADVVEIGVPFSDPIADGPVIQASSQRALELGMNFDRVLEMTAEAGLEIPVVLFSYLNPLLAAGSTALSRCREAGIDGILVTDLPVGADPEREAWLGGSELAFVRLAAPTTPVERMREIARNGSGFVYLISRLGVTGARSDVPGDLAATTARLREATELPICIGFGIAEPAQAREVAMIGDGVVIGSALVREAGAGIGGALALTRAIRKAIDD